ncbi:MAG: Rieske 2Fe-2S domain-containing protein [Solirubrobacteraceae bacterium]|jgi:nitrite reductase/ring-hydroxylating ferredoxin subunit
MRTFQESDTRLVAVEQLSASQVAVVQTRPHGALAVGVSAGKPFAVSNSNCCRHLFASLGEGHVTNDGCLQCPWHGGLCDVRTGAVVRGLQDAFKPPAGAVKTNAARSLKTFPVEVRDGEIRLVG